MDVKILLESLGFLIAHEKCQWSPVQKIDWLGYTWNTETGKVFVKDSRIEKAEGSIKKLCQEIANGKLVFSARFLASVVGQLISMQIVIGNTVRFYTRYLYECVMARASWNAPVKISSQAYTELLFWDQSLRRLNDQGNDISQKDDFKSDFDIFCDASDVGFGGHLCPDGNIFSVLEVSGNWTQEEGVESSTWRELECVKRVLHTCANEVTDKRILVNSDNKNVQHILSVGSKKSKLQGIATDIRNFCKDNSAILKVNWLPRSGNQYADELSRNIDNDDWYVNIDIFNDLNGSWGPFTIDRFATHYNKQCERFN